VTLGTRSYTQAELQSVFVTEPGGNGLISLAHQLGAAKLNVASGASSWPIASELAAADALIGARVAPPVGTGALDSAATLGLTNALGQYNAGLKNVPHCN
jgi:hypothetical protein